MAANFQRFASLRNYGCFSVVFPAYSPLNLGRKYLVPFRWYAERSMSNRSSERPKTTPQNTTKHRRINLNKGKESRTAAVTRLGLKTVEKTIEGCLEEWGISVKKVKSQMDVSKLTVERSKKVFRFLRDVGLERVDVGRVINRRPGVLVMKEELLKARVEAMAKSGIQPDALVYVVKQSPGVLTAKTEETLPQKIKFFQDLKVKPKLATGEILHILTKCPDLIAACSLSSLKEKVAFLENDLKFNRHQVRNIVIKQPSTLTFSTSAIQEKYRYCFDEMNVSPSSIARCPRVFQCSLKRIRERHLFLKECGRLVEGMIVDDFGLGAMITPSDKNFAEKVAKSSLEELEDFRKTLSV